MGQPVDDVLSMLHPGLRRSRTSALAAAPPWCESTCLHARCCVLLQTAMRTVWAACGNEKLLTSVRCEAAHTHALVDICTHLNVQELIEGKTLPGVAALDNQPVHA